MRQTAAEYLYEIVRRLDSLPGAFDESPLLDVRSEDRALLIARRALREGIRLVTTVLADTSGSRVEWLSYRFHLMDADGQCILRYDNAPHHSELGGFPHHKHVGADERVVESGPIDFGAILEEVRHHIEGR